MLNIQNRLKNYLKKRTHLQLRFSVICYCVHLLLQPLIKLHIYVIDIYIYQEFQKMLKFLLLNKQYRNHLSLLYEKMICLMIHFIFCQLTYFLLIINNKVINTVKIISFGFLVKKLWPKHYLHKKRITSWP